MLFRSDNLIGEHVFLYFNTFCFRVKLGGTYGRIDCTVLISSHMLSEIELIADDIGILNHGRMLFEGSMNDLRQYALQSGFAADNLEDVFLSMVEKDNMDRKQRAKL